ncbi:MAG: hypothetical protein HOQ11_07270 [Gemmatimonadaceae bacterium]|nr:hypothetical protein [Gemmatimonadaceae bacterium]NUQ92574.1 hypothetical protein [Gemmatimonadaceae bacterium]NUR34913.1 hypothetical protein [Gemmatimonadaceae bacterium]NUS97191.1 hypothetical protein [Gemmatimonadaceae bacterium]
MRYTALVLAAMLAACGTKQDKTEDSAAGRVPADSDVAAQGTGIPAGYTAITDDSSAKLTSIRYAANGASWEVTTGPAHVIFAPGDTASGTYTASATFDQLETPRHPEAYGLFVGGRDLESPNRSYTYFLVRGNGQFLVKSREGANTKDVIAWTASPAVPRADSAGRGSYRLAVRVGADSVRFMVNDKQVGAVKAGTVATNGVAGVRVNHNLHVRTGPVRITR